MRIGEFSNKYRIVRDTTRYYMELELLNPEKKGGQYIFCDRDEDALKEILKLKKLEFTLKEIGDINLHRNLGKMTSYENGDMSKEPYVKKLDEIRKRIEVLEDISKDLEQEITREEIYSTPNDSGIGISHLEMLRCVKCGNDLEISNGR